jgi:hypothetical protein
MVVIAVGEDLGFPSGSSSAIDREKRPTVAVPVREGGRLRFQFHSDHVEVSPGTFGASVRIDKELFRQVVAAADATWGRPLHPAEFRAVVNMDLEESTRILVDDVCNNCGAPFTHSSTDPSGSAPHYPQSLGVCLMEPAHV